MSVVAIARQRSLKREPRRERGTRAIARESSLENAKIENTTTVARIKNDA
ncbi:hypothetical protein [Oxynema aestuarii]|uniref:Uncharacterized protein n=1 Tax=Oxynema aestuarii AP17 TaxID=2064643 RepID=A0A6H1TVC0_9CYAN|nr:hypothetical protein [Oxynema aestuarii]QIZ70166.1 hypothetical protein HCG48_05955 [Oxynema aestuarii AP17]